MYIIGRKAVLEALNNNKEIDKLLIKTDEIEGTLKVIVAKAKEQGIVVQKTAKQKLELLAEGLNHQGVIAICPASKYVEVEDILQSAKEKGEQPFILILDEIMDPHNLGAIIRTAEAFSVHGIIISKRRSASLTETVIKTSAGATEHVLVAKVTNISTTIDYLKKQGLWIACADASGEAVYSASLNCALALVLGNEGFGVSRLVKEKSDFIVSIPMFGKISSLNVSVAAGILMYQITKNKS